MGTVLVYILIPEVHRIDHFKKRDCPSMTKDAHLLERKLEILENKIERKTFVEQCNVSFYVSSEQSVGQRS